MRAIPSPNLNPKSILLLHLSRQISTPSHLSQLLSLTITSNLFTSPFLNTLLHSLSLSTSSPSLSFSLLNSIHKHHYNHNTPIDGYTLTSSLKAASSLSLLSKGQELHALGSKLGLDYDAFVLNSLINMYSVCGSVDCARKVFDLAEDFVRDVVSWNTLISGYLKSHLNGEALWVFGKMVNDCVGMDRMTPVSALIAVGRVGLKMLGRKMHALVVVNGFKLDFYLGSSLVSMYARCGDLEVARKVFDGIRVKNVVCWNSMISGYLQSSRYRESVELFREMQAVRVRPDDSTVACVASCCGQMGALDHGRYLDAYCAAKGVGNELVAKNAFIDMYSKCGDIERALQIFEGLVQPDVFSWTAMICGLATNGHPHKALEMFSLMEGLGKVVPNEITFLGVLSACSHGGLVEQGFHYFECMIRVYKLTARIEHYGCMVDLLGRTKLLKEAERFIREMPIEPDVVIWRSLLFACRTYGEVKLAEFAAKRMIELEPSMCDGHVLLSNAYAEASMWSDVKQVRTTMNERSIQKEPGCSYIEINGSVHEFLAADSAHNQMEDIHRALWGIGKTILSDQYTSVMFHATHG